MNRYKISKVTGTGKKQEITTAMADSFDYMGYGNYAFYRHQLSLFGKVKRRDLVHHFANNGTLLIVESDQIQIGE